MDVPAYFELSWSILSTIGLFLTIIGVWAILITRVSPLHLVPIVVSVACAVANGLCYYAFYAEHSIRQRVVASVFADIFWLVCFSIGPVLSNVRLLADPGDRSRKQVSLSIVIRSSSIPS
jgi:hypothetical protein